MDIKFTGHDVFSTLEYSHPSGPSLSIEISRRERQRRPSVFEVRSSPCWGPPVGTPFLVSGRQGAARQGSRTQTSTPARNVEWYEVGLRAHLRISIEKHNVGVEGPSRTWLQSPVRQPAIISSMSHFEYRLKW
ncbi:hypothetical protein Dda_8669 [Drechslerella dactyloides]|uniref:Uncharacterized protein n=1 Tax=Drechslerella dactyloides TaxID=74499 RepID=A0AAD6IU40_DREDA|nr:hypothetical protein Dda_8669 [Drechslerella dactyloides]